MPFNIACPSCGALIKVGDAAIGKTVKCPKCASPMIVADPAPAPKPKPRPRPAPAEVPVVAAVDDTEEPAPRRRRDRRDDDAEPRKTKKSNKGLIIGLS